MEATNQNGKKVFQSLNFIAKSLENSELNITTRLELQLDIQIVADYLGVTDMQALLFSLIFRLNCNEFHSGVQLRDLSVYLDFDLVSLMGYHDDLSQLVDRHILKSALNRRDTDVKALNYRYSVPSNVLDKVLQNHPLGDLQEDNVLDIYEYVELISSLIQERSNENILTLELFIQARDIETKNSCLPMLSKLKEMNIAFEDRLLFYEICADFMKSGNTGLETTFSDIYDSLSVRFKKLRAFKEKDNDLLRNDLIQLGSGNFLSEIDITLTENGKELFLGEDACLFYKRKESSQLIYPDNIPNKSLFYDEDLKIQVKFLENSLQQTNFQNLQTRLTEKSLPKGLTAIFYGEPGTGKTETVYQLAKLTGRALMHVDISQSKSMFFGESEKKIKDIFVTYNQFCTRNEVKPILLFNEADAIFGKRSSDRVSSNVAQTENAIQNIILEEMEKLQGVLIATTNLNQNLDAAFERRFLFKVKFSNPSMEIKQKIWQNKITWLTEEAANALATRYALSGGEIENVVRKITMQEVLSGIAPSVNELIEHCEREKFLNKGSQFRVGF